MHDTGCSLEVCGALCNDFNVATVLLSVEGLEELQENGRRVSLLPML